MHSETGPTRFPLPRALIIFTMTVLPAEPAKADLDELYKLSLGANVTRFNTELTINSKDGSIDTGINLEDDLGFDTEVDTGWLSAWYRVGERHRLRLTYVPVRRTAVVVSNKDLVIDNTTIKAGASVSSEVNTDTFDFSYIYSLYKRPRLEFGLSAGLYWLRTSTSIYAQGSVKAEGDVDFQDQSEFASSQKLNAPLPLLGFILDYEFNASWRSRVAARYLAVSIDEIDGSLFALELGVEYYLNRSWGLGVSVSRFQLDVDADGVVLENSFTFAQGGAQLYGTFKY